MWVYIREDVKTIFDQNVIFLQRRAYKIVRFIEEKF